MLKTTSLAPLLLKSPGLPPVSSTSSSHPFREPLLHRASPGAWRLSGTLLLLLLAGRVGANGADAPTTASRPDTRYVASLAGAWGTTKLLGGATDPDRGSTQFQLGWRKTLRQRPGLLLEYALEVVPIELAFGTRVAASRSAQRIATVYGAGLDPLGLEAHFGQGRLRPYAALRTGFRVFARQVPTPRGTHFNFVFDAGAGLEWRLRSERWVFAAVELHHLSNGGLGEANPSLNLVALRAGLALRR